MAPSAIRTLSRLSRQRRALGRACQPIEQLEGRTLLSSVTFGQPISTTIATFEFLVAQTATGDLNGDGIPDLVASRQGLTAQVYLGTAGGTFNPGQTLPSGGNPIALGDFNGDTTLDLATTDGVYPGIGDGTFGPVIPGFSLPTGTVNMYAEDVNGDGMLDLVCATYTAPTGQNANPVIALSVLIGNGNGTFQSAVTTQIGTGAGLTPADATCAFGDFNNDTKLDIVTPFGVMIGTDTAAFSQPIALPFKSLSGGTTAALPSQPELAVGDFNGDGNLDIVTLPTASSTGQIEIFLGTGGGTFIDNGPVAVTGVTTITTLTAADVNGDGNLDLLAGTQSASGVQEIAVLLNTGSGSFGSPTFFNISGVSTSITAEDFNADGNPDLLSIDEAPGSASGVTLTATADVLLANQQAGTAPLLSLNSSANPDIAGNPVTYTARVSAPVGSALPVPTGTVTFFNGATSIGTGTLANGKATLVVTAEGVGAEPITFSYPGDANFAAANSSVLRQIVLVSGSKAPLLLPSFGIITLAPEFLPGDKGVVPVAVTDGGDASANGKVSIALYLSASGAIDSSAIPLNVPTLQNKAIHLSRGGSVIFMPHITTVGVPAGVYYVVGQMTAVSGFTSDQVSQSAIVSPATYEAAGLVFGDLGTHRGLRLNVTDPFGSVANLSITGPGSGSVTDNNGAIDITVTSTTPGSVVSIVSRNPFTVNSIILNGELSRLAARKTILTGGLSVAGGVKNLTLAGVSGNAPVPITLGGAFPLMLQLGNVGVATLSAASAIKNLSAAGWQGGSIDAPAINNLVINGAFGASVNVPGGGKLMAARLGGITGGTWAISGGIGSLHVAGSVADAGIYAGADAGFDNILGTADDAFGQGSIGSIFIGGSDTSSLFIAGGEFPVDADLNLSELILLDHSSIPLITVRGAISDDSRFLAHGLPATAVLDGVHVKTAGDPHFAV